MTFNIRHGEAGLDRVVALLGDLGADVVFLQELDRGCARSGGVDQVASIAQALSMEFAFAESFPFDGGSYGVAILAKAALGAAERVCLPHPSPRHDDGNGEPRVLLRASCGGLVLACTHLGLSALERVDQARAVRELLGHEERLLLGGDLNEGPGGDVVGAWDGWLVDAFQEAMGQEKQSSPHDRPQARIDFILRGKRTPSPLAAFVGPAGVSDHRPVIVDFE